MAFISYPSLSNSAPTPSITTPFSFEGAITAISNKILTQSTPRDYEGIYSLHIPVSLVSPLAHVFFRQSQASIPERELLRKIHQLHQLLELFQNKDTKAALEYCQKQLDSELFGLLCEGIWYAHQTPSGDDKYGQHILEKKPQVLLEIITCDGENLIEKCIQELEAIGQHKQFVTLLDQGHLSKEKLVKELQTGMKSWGQLLKINPSAQCIALKYLRDRILNVLQGYFRYFDLTSEEKVALARHLIENGKTEFLMQYISEFRLSVADSNEIVHLCLTKAPRALAAHLDQFCLSQEEQIVLLYTLIENQDIPTLAANIHKFRIPMFVLQEITSLCVQKHPGIIAEYAQHFPLLTEQDHIHLATAAVNVHPENCMRYIKTLKLPELTRFTFAQKYQLYLEAESPVYFYKDAHFSAFDLGREHHMQLELEHIVRTDHSQLPQRIDQYSNDLSEQSRYEYALMYQIRRPHEFIQNLELFKLNSQHTAEVLLSFAKAMSQKSMSYAYSEEIVSVFCQLVPLPDENTRFQFALCWLVCPEIFSDYPTLLKLAPTHQILFLRELAQYSPCLAIQNLSDVQEENVRFELAKSCITNCPADDLGLVKLLEMMRQTPMRLSTSARRELCRLLIDREPAVFRGFILEVDEWLVDALEIYLDLSPMHWEEGMPVATKIQHLCEHYRKELITIAEHSLKDHFGEFVCFCLGIKSVRDEDKIEIIQYCINTREDTSDLPSLYRGLQDAQLCELSLGVKVRICRSLFARDVDILSGQQGGFSEWSIAAMQVYLEVGSPHTNFEEPIPGSELTEKLINFGTKYKNEIISFIKNNIDSEDGAITELCYGFIYITPISKDLIDILKQETALSHRELLRILISEEFAKYHPNVSEEPLVELLKLCLAKDEIKIEMIFPLNIKNRALQAELLQFIFRNQQPKRLCDLIDRCPIHWLSPILEVYLNQRYPSAGFTEIVTEINQIEDQYVQQELFVWLAETIEKLESRLDEEDQLWIAKQNMLGKIAHLPLPEVRPMITADLIKTARHMSILASSNARQKATDSKNSTFKERADLLFIYYCAFLENGVSRDCLTKFWDQINSRDLILNTHHFATIILTLHNLLNRYLISSEELEHIFSRLYESSFSTIHTNHKKTKRVKDNEQLLRELSSLTTILDFNVTEILMTPGQSFSELIEPLFKKHLRLGDIPDFNTKYENTFKTFRYPEGLYTFMGKMYRKGNNYLESLAEFVGAVLTGEFPASRYSLENNPHLKNIETAVIEKWKAPTQAIPVQSGVTQAIVPLDWLKNSIEHDHFPLNQYPHLKEFKQDYSEEHRQQLLAKIDAELKNDPKNEQLQVESECLFLIDANNNNLINNLRKLQALLSKNDYEFCNDIQVFIKSLTTPQKLSHETLIAIDTDQPDYIFNCGKDVGSCQRWDGDPDNCCGLLGYLLHGQTRLLAVMDVQGKIRSRAILRLLLDEKNNPVIFLEGCYPANAPATHTQALLQLAKNKAAEMGLPLTACHWSITPKPEPYPTPLRSLGGPAAAEYSDAAVGYYRSHVHRRGEFEIHNAFYIKPTQVVVK